MIVQLYSLILLLKNEPPHQKTNNLHKCENNGADQIRGNREADKRLCVRYLDSTIPLLRSNAILLWWFFLFYVLVFKNLCAICALCMFSYF